MELFGAYPPAFGLIGGLNPHYLIPKWKRQSYSKVKGRIKYDTIKKPVNTGFFNSLYCWQLIAIMVFGCQEAIGVFICKFRFVFIPIELLSCSVSDIPHLGQDGDMRSSLHRCMQDALIFSADCGYKVFHVLFQAIIF